MITLGVYLLWGVTSVIGQASTSPVTQPPPQHTSKASPLSPSALRQLQAKAESGDPSAQASLGKAYEDGNGVPRNDDQAFKWYRKAAEQGDAESQNRVGVLYSVGRGTEPSKEQAVAWYRKAAHQKNDKAMFNLGAAYYNGDGLTIDDVTSYAWFLLAADAGNPSAKDATERADAEKMASRGAALAKIGDMYVTGAELPKDPIEALKWYRKAADVGNEKASVMVASLLLADGRNATPDENAEARQRCEDAAKRKFPPGAYCMALIYRRGLGVAKDPVESAKWLGRAAELGHPRAALQLGEAYWKGEGVKPDPVIAYTWIWLAYNSRVSGAEQDEQELGKELSAKQVQQAKQKASDWARAHRIGGLRQSPPDNPPATK
jgi:TPR repeat protein